MTLDRLQNGEKGIIVKVRGRGAFRKRILEMGFVRGQKVEVIKNAPFRDPVEYKIMGYNISLRRSEAGLIDVIPPWHDDAQEHLHIRNELPPLKKAFRKRRHQTHLHSMEFDKTGTHHMMRQELSTRRLRHRRRVPLPDDLPDPGMPLSEKKHIKSKTINVALVGNPNSGKTTLFNFASGSRERVSNYGGVTIEAKKATFKHKGYTFDIIDLPGTYSITEYSREELFVREYILNNAPDVVINVVDATNLERNLYLTTQLIDMDIKVVIALNMYDEMENAGDVFDYTSLGKMIGIPFIPTVATNGSGVRELFDRIIDVYEDRDSMIRHIHINYGNDIERAIEAIEKTLTIEDNFPLTDLISPRYIVIKLLEKDKNTEERVFQTCQNRREIIKETQTQVEKLESSLKSDSETLITDAKYGFIAGALKETLVHGHRPEMSLSEKIDSILTHNIIGFPIFIFFMWLTFYLTFTLGEHPMNWIDSFMGHLSHFITLKMPDGILKHLIVDGIMAGVGGVIIFLPNILILFFLISFMEDTGYMARAAFIMDKLMHKIGLHGKSFIPLIMGFGCNVPAIMATRTLESRNDRLLTMLIIPFMSCSARLPVYVLFISAFFPDYPGTMLFLIYMIGITLAITAGITLKKTLFKTEEIPFVMELPPYRMPQMRTAARHMWEKGVEYLKKIGGIILVGSIIIWFLGHFPVIDTFSRDYDGEIKHIKKTYEETMQSVKRDGIAETSSQTLQTMKTEMESGIEQIKYEKESERLTRSYIGQLGQSVEPIMRPLNFDWKMSVSILTGLAAKEVVVGTMGVLYHAEPEVGKGEKSLIHKLQTQVHTSGPLKGEKVFTPLIAFSFILFILIYFPCVGVMAAIKRESGSWKWAAFTALYTTVTAWIITFIFQRIAGLFF